MNRFFIVSDSDNPNEADFQEEVSELDRYYFSNNGDYFYDEHKEMDSVLAVKLISIKFKDY